MRSVPTNCVTRADGAITCDTKGRNHCQRRGRAPITTLSTTDLPVNQPHKLGKVFLEFVDGGERIVARLLTLITAVVIVAALLQLIAVAWRTCRCSKATRATPGWGMTSSRVLGDLLTVLIALEVLQNITSYLRRHVVQIELVLVTALTAVARKVIVLPTGAENKPQLLSGLGIAALSLAASYWLVRRSAPIRMKRTSNTKLSQKCSRLRIRPLDTVTLMR